MANHKLYGTGVALVTPFKANGNLDVTGLDHLLKFTAQKGVDYYVVMGTTGESVTLTSKEKENILRYVKDNNGHNLPIVYGIGGNNTAEILDQLQKTDLEQVAALLSVSPYYNKPSQEGIIQHYTSIADRSPVPVILYNVPGRTGSNIMAETTLKLSEHENIIGIKEASGDIGQALQIMKYKPSDFMLISGDDLLTVPLYAIGAVGVISVLANAFGDVFKSIKTYVQAEDYGNATAELLHLVEINPLMYAQSNPVGIKQVLQEFGVCENHVRLPLVTASQPLQEKIRETLAFMRQYSL